MFSFCLSDTKMNHLLRDALMNTWRYVQNIDEQDLRIE